MIFNGGSMGYVVIALGVALQNRNESMGYGWWYAYGDGLQHRQHRKI